MFKKCLGLGLGLLFFCGFVAAIPLKVTCTNRLDKRLSFSVNLQEKGVDPDKSETLSVDIDPKLAYKVQVYEKKPNNGREFFFSAYYARNIKTLEADTNGNVYVDSKFQPERFPKDVQY